MNTAAFVCVKVQQPMGFQGGRIIVLHGKIIGFSSIFTDKCFMTVPKLTH